MVVLGVADEDGQRAGLPVKHDGVQRRVVVDGPRGVLPTADARSARLRVAQHVDHLLQVLGHLHLRSALVSGDGVGQAHVVGVHHVVGVRVPVRSAGRGHEDAVLRVNMQLQPHLPEGSHLEVEELSRLQVEQLVVVARGEGVLREASHRVVDVLRVQQVAAHEHAAHAVRIGRLRHQVVHRERQMLIPAVRYASLPPCFPTCRGDLGSIGEGRVVRNQLVVYASTPQAIRTDVELFLHDDGLIEIDHAGSVLVVDNDGVILRLENVVGAVRGGGELELAGNNVTKFLLQHVQEELVEGGAGAVRHSVQFFHVVREDTGLHIRTTEEIATLVSTK